MGRSLNGSIAVEHFDCPMCSEPLRPPIFQHTTSGNFICQACGDELQNVECPECSNSLIVRCFAMESVVESIRVGCAYASHGCTAKTIYYDKEEHKKACPYWRCFCPEPRCGFAGRSAELWDHFVSHHGWRAETFSYFKRFDVLLRLGFYVLRGENDGQIFVLYVERAGPHSGHATISIACVRAGATESKYGCSLSFSCFKGHHGSSTLGSIPCSTLSDGPPTGCFCLVPNASGEGDDGVLLTVIICTRMGCDNDVALEDDDDEGSSHDDEDDA